MLSDTKSSMQILTKAPIEYKTQGCANVFQSIFMNHIMQEKNYETVLFLQDSNDIMDLGNGNKRVAKKSRKKRQQKGDNILKQTLLKVIHQNEMNKLPQAGVT